MSLKRGVPFISNHELNIQTNLEIHQKLYLYFIGEQFNQIMIIKTIL